MTKQLRWLAAVLAVGLLALLMLDAPTGQKSGNQLKPLTLASGTPTGLGFMGTDIYGIPFAVDRSINPIIGQGSVNETQALNATLGINFRSPESGNFDKFRQYYATNEGAPGPYYASGTGGVVRIRLHDADTNGYPIGAALDEIVWRPNLVNGCRYASPCTLPSDPSYQVAQWAPFDWPNNPAIVAGNLYVVTMENIDSSPSTNFVRLLMPDFYEHVDDNSGGYSYLGLDDGYKRQNFGFVYKLGNTWRPGNTWSSGSGNRADPLPMFGALLTNGASFGQSGWLSAADHGAYHGAANPLGSGCTQNGPGTMPCNYGPNASPGEEFIPSANMTATKVHIGLVPYVGGDVSLQIQDATGAVLRACSVATPTMDQSNAHPYWAFIRSRIYSCVLPTPIALSAGVKYKLRVVSPVATGSVLLLGDATVWPFNIPPMADMMGASINGRYIAPDGGVVGFYDMQFGLRVTAPGVSAVGTVTVTPMGSCVSADLLRWEAATSVDASSVTLTVTGTGAGGGPYNPPLVGGPKVWFINTGVPNDSWTITATAVFPGGTRVSAPVSFRKAASCPTATTTTTKVVTTTTTTFVPRAVEMKAWCTWYSKEQKTKMTPTMRAFCTELWRSEIPNHTLG